MPIAITATAAPPRPGRTANHFGVGEIVDLVCAIAPAPALKPAFKWAISSTSKDNKLSVNNGNASQARLILGGTVKETLRVTVTDSLSNTIGTLDLSIQVPEGLSLGPPYVQGHTQNTASAGFKSVMRFRNASNVNFANIELREGFSGAKASGYLAFKAQDTHGASQASHPWLRVFQPFPANDPSNPPIAVAANAHCGVGYEGFGFDRVASGCYGTHHLNQGAGKDGTPADNRPFREGGEFSMTFPWTFRVVIPAATRDANNVVVNMPASSPVPGMWMVHKETLSANGTIRVEKGGQSVQYAFADASVNAAAIWPAAGW